MAACDHLTQCQNDFSVCKIGISSYGICSTCWPKYLKCLSTINSQCYDRQHIQNLCEVNYECGSEFCAWSTDDHNSSVHYNKLNEVTLIIICLIFLFLFTAIFIKIVICWKKRRQEKIDSLDSEFFVITDESS